MDFNEALNELIDAVADVEEHGDAIDVLQKFVEDRSGEADNEWKDKYMKLESEYKKRFKDKMKESANNTGVINESEDEKEITVEDLDFNGKTE